MDKINFNHYDLSDEIKDALKDLGFKNPTQVQSEVIPLALEKEDLVVKSQTGSGKTAAYAVPICELIDWMKNRPQALILTPTRELAIQVKEDFTNIGRYKRIKATALYGGQQFVGQQIELKQKTHVVVGTPGRILDHIKKETLRLDLVDYLVIDEADEMLNMGFIDQVESIIKSVSRDRVTMLFSATMPDGVKRLSRRYMNTPMNIEIVSDDDVNAKDLVPASDQMIEETNHIQNNIEHIQYKTEEIDKLSLLLKLTMVENPDSCIIFCNTQEQVNVLYDRMNNLNYSCDKIHGGLEQKERMSAMNGFKRGEFRYLIATNLVARGIDVEDVSLIINYDIPPSEETYIHRTGRTARAGLHGKAISLVTPYDERYMKMIKEHIGFDILTIMAPTSEEILSAKADFESKMKKKPVIREKKSIILDKQIMKLRFNTGKKKGVRATTFVGLISNIEGVTAEDIGIITVMDTLSFVEILNGKGSLVLNAMKKIKIKEKPLKVTKVK